MTGWRPHRLTGIAATATATCMLAVTGVRLYICLLSGPHLVVMPMPAHKHRAVLQACMSKKMEPRGIMKAERNWPGRVLRLLALRQCNTLERECPDAANNQLREMQPNDLSQIQAHTRGVQVATLPVVALDQSSWPTDCKANYANKRASGSR